MKRAVFLLATLLVCSIARGQGGNIPNTIISVFPGAPTGACGNTMVAVRTDTGAFYDCFGAAWNAVAGGGGGTVTAVTGTAPVTSTGGTTPAIGCATCATTSTGTTNTLPKYSSATNIGNSLFTDDGTTGQYAGAGGFQVPSDGVHAGGLGVLGNTTAPALKANSFYWLGPNSASFTAYALQPAAVGPAATSFMQFAALSSGISAATYVGVTGTGNVVLANSPALSGAPTTPTATSGDSSTQIASDAFVSNAISGVNPAVAVQAATTAAANTSGFTYNNGVSGVGATFTGSVNTAVTIDGFTFTAVGQRLLVKNDTQAPSGAFNGIYTLTVLQTIAVAPVFTRALDFDTPSDINNTGAIPVVNGTVNASTSWVVTSTVNTVGTDPVTFTQFSLNPSNVVTQTANGAANQVCTYTGANKVCVPGSVTNAMLSNSSTTVNGTTCTLGSTCTVGGSAWQIGFGTSAAGVANTTNTVSLHSFYLPTTTTFTRIWANIATADASDLYDFGIYSNCINGATATLAADSGAIAITATGPKDVVITQGTVTLQPGWYCFAWTGNAATLNWQKETGRFVYMRFAFGATAGASSGGVLPGTITAPNDAFTFAATGQMDAGVR